MLKIVSAQKLRDTETPGRLSPYTLPHSGAGDCLDSKRPGSQRSEFLAAVGRKIQAWPLLLFRAPRYWRRWAAKKVSRHRWSRFG